MSVETKTIQVNADWLNLCPTGLLVLDNDGHICWANAALAEMLALPVEHLLGKDSSTLPTHDTLFNGDAQVQIITEQGTERWLSCTQRTATDEDGKQIKLHFYQDITQQVEHKREYENMDNRLAALSTSDNLTGLPNQRSLVQALSDQVTRSRRYHNPLTLAMLRIERIDATNESESSLPEETLIEISQCLRDRLRWADIVGRYNDDYFMVILPETNREAAENLICDLQGAISEIPLPDGTSLLCRIGFTEWLKGRDPRAMLKSALATTQSAAND